MDLGGGVFRHGGAWTGQCQKLLVAISLELFGVPPIKSFAAILWIIGILAPPTSTLQAFVINATYYKVGLFFLQMITTLKFSEITYDCPTQAGMSMSSIFSSCLN